MTKVDCDHVVLGACGHSIFVLLTSLSWWRTVCPLNSAKYDIVTSLSVCLSACTTR